MREQLADRDRPAIALKADDYVGFWDGPWVLAYRNAIEQTRAAGATARTSKSSGPDAAAGEDEIKGVVLWVAGVLSLLVLALALMVPGMRRRRRKPRRTGSRIGEQ
jgi:hypothetical protein